MTIASHVRQLLRRAPARSVRPLTSLERRIAQVARLTLRLRRATTALYDEMTAELTHERAPAGSTTKPDRSNPVTR